MFSSPLYRILTERLSVISLLVFLDIIRRGVAIADLKITKAFNMSQKTKQPEYLSFRLAHHTQEIFTT